MTPDIEAILASGATILVNAAATDAWKAVHAGFTRLFGRGEPTKEATAARRLDALVTAVDQAEPGAVADLRDQERTRWLVRLTDLVEDDPSALDELRTLVERLTTQSPPQQQAWVQSNVARDTGQVFATQGGGTINIHKGASPEA
jgi:hypothetical protein